MYQENNVFLLGLRVVASLYWDREQGLEQIDALLRLREQYPGSL
jgi:hypothetical protein